MKDNITALNLPNAPLKITKSADGLYTTCLLRKKRIKLTPEEWVRQHIVYFLIKYRNYPSGLIQIEQGIHIHQLFRRCDLILNDRNAKPRVIVECKAPTVKLSPLTFEQAAHYNQHLQVDYLLLTNGLEHQIYQIDTANQQLEILQDIPDFKDL